jgi:hypothetical protein
MFFLCVGSESAKVTLAEFKQNFVVLLILFISDLKAKIQNQMISFKTHLVHNIT